MGISRGLLTLAALLPLAGVAAGCTSKLERQLQDDVTLLHAYTEARGAPFSEGGRTYGQTCTIELPGNREVKVYAHEPYQTPDGNEYAAGTHLIVPTGTDGFKETADHAGYGEVDSCGVSYGSPPPEGSPLGLKGEQDLRVAGEHTWGLGGDVRPWADFGIDYSRTKEGGIARERPLGNIVGVPTDAVIGFSPEQRDLLSDNYGSLAHEAAEHVRANATTGTFLKWDPDTICKENMTESKPLYKFPDRPALP